MNEKRTGKIIIIISFTILICLVNLVWMLIRNYIGTENFENRKHAKAVNLNKQNDFLSSMGKEFVIFIIPDKVRVYSEYMPDKYGPTVLSKRSGSRKTL